MAARVRVAVLFGGRSTEHAISCLSAGSVLRAIDRERYDVLPIGIRPDGRWVLMPDKPELLEARGRELPGVDPDAQLLVLPPDPTVGRLLEPREDPGVMSRPDPFVGLPTPDVVFPLLHGAYGEDGTVQGLLEMASIPYVGSGVFASAASMDKAHMKAMLAAAGLAVGPYEVVRAGQELSVEAKERLGLPVFVKPARGGSSVGIVKVTDWAALPAAMAEARAADPKVVIESAIAGREIECAVLGSLGGGPPKASLPAEIKLAAGYDFYDFEAKYLSDATEFDIPAVLPAGVTERVQQLAIEAFEAMDCAGLARVDVFVDTNTDSVGEPVIVVNEVNTMPGFTPASMYPKMWQASGLEYPQLIDRLLQLALERGTGLH
jgi:D-alanine-D-alanine ligase